MHAHDDTESLSTDCTPDGPSLVETHSALIEGAIAVVCRKRRLSREEREELASDVYLKLLDKDCAVLRQFRGNSRLGTFLVVVVQRVLLDARSAKWGRWRPSAAATRLGPVAIGLERLVIRDGVKREEAEASLRHEKLWPEDDDALQRLMAGMAARTRRRFVDVEQLEALADPAANPEEGLLRAATDALAPALARVVSELPPDDQALLTLRFGRGLSICRIARLKGLEPRVAYRRFERLLRRLRADLTDRRGVAA